MVFSLSALWWIRTRGLWKLHDGRHWLRGKLGLVDGRTMLSNSLIQFSVEGRGCVPSLLFDLRSNYGGGDADRGSLLQNFPWTRCCIQGLQPCSRPLLTHATARDSWTLTGKSGSVYCGAPAPFSWVLVHRVLFLLSQGLFPQCWGMFWQLCGAFNGDLFQEHLCHPQVCWSRAPIPVAGHCWPTYTGDAQTLKGRSGSVCGVSRYTQVLVWALWMSLEGLF